MGVSQIDTCGNTTVYLTSLACTYMASDTRTERLNTSHMDDMINMVMFTFKATSSHVMIGCGVVDLDRVSLNNQRDIEFSGSSLVI